MSLLRDPCLALQVTRQVEESVAAGARILIGGPADPEMNRTGGTFYQPTVLVDMTQNMTPFQEETFGPIAPLMRFKTEEEAIIIANNTKYEQFTQEVCHYVFFHFLSY
jgi:succinate-semialdehyde dehydrogenase / glutarate-semialdehyde dehydrogenase